MKKFDKKRVAAVLSSAFIAASAVPFTGLSTASAADTVVYGDATLDGDVSLADALLILQHVANASKYPLSEKAADNADVYSRGDGITAMDALSIQKYDAKVIKRLLRLMR